MFALNFVIFWAMILCGCARRPAHSGVNYIVEPADLTAPILLLGCDHAEPPHCKRIRASYKPGREKLLARQVTK